MVLRGSCEKITKFFFTFSWVAWKLENVSISSRSETWGQYPALLNASSTTDWHWHSHNKPPNCPVQWLFISESSNDVFTMADYQHRVSNCDFNENWHETKSGKQCESVISAMLQSTITGLAYLGIFQIHMIKTSRPRIEEGCILVPAAAGLWSPGPECRVSCIFV